MRLLKKILSGRIDSKGKLQINKDSLQEFCQMHKDRAVFVRVDVQPKEPSQKLKNFVFGYIVPTMKWVFHDNGHDFNEEQTWYEIRRSCPIFIAESYTIDGWQVRVREWEELDSAEAVEFVAWVQRWCAEHFHYPLDDPQ